MPKRKKREILLYSAGVLVSVLFSTFGGVLALPSIVGFWVCLYKALYAFFSCRGRIDWEAVNWYALDPILQEAHDAMEKLKDVRRISDDLATCDPDDVPDIVSTVWKHWGEEKQRKLSFMLDGEDDIRDWIIYCDKKEQQYLKELDELTDEIQKWREENISTEGTGAKRKRNVRTFTIRRGDGENAEVEYEEEIEIDRRKRRRK